MTRLNDLQTILLSTASQREDGSLLPLLAKIEAGSRVTKAIAALIGRGLAAERETRDPAATYRTDDDLSWGVFVTLAGLAAIGVENDIAAEPDATTAVADGHARSPKAPTKASIVLALLTRPEGASLPELIEVTGWLPHTTRAALTGLRKKGHAVERSKRDGATCYRIAEAA